MSGLFCYDFELNTPRHHWNPRIGHRNQHGSRIRHRNQRIPLRQLFDFVLFQHLLHLRRRMQFRGEGVGAEGFGHDDGRLRLVRPYPFAALIDQLPPWNLFAFVREGFGVGTNG